MKRTGEEYIEDEFYKKLCPFAYLVDKRYVVIDLYSQSGYEDVMQSCEDENVIFSDFEEDLAKLAEETRLFQAMIGEEYYGSEDEDPIVPFEDSRYGVIDVHKLLKYESSASPDLKEYLEELVQDDRAPSEVTGEECGEDVSRPDKYKDPCPFVYSKDERYTVIDVHKLLKCEGLLLFFLDQYFEKVIQADRTFPKITREECFDDECSPKTGKECREELYRPKLRHPQVYDWIARRHIVFPSNGKIDEGTYIAMDCAIRIYFRLKEEKKKLLSLIRENKSLNKRCSKRDDDND